MNENLVRLYNTMLQIETKGESTKIMADCLRFVENLAKEAAQPATTEEPVPVQAE
jgi:hypothetical protein